ncbi:MAG TPA: hypothetical protein VEC19_06365 [Usitatibacter sp.]|nr:hypothetical protein [Usitatibacter sp.]
MLTDLRLWRLQRHTALLALPLVVAHVILQLWVFGGDNRFDVVSARVKLGMILALDVVLLAVVSAHAFLGLRSMLQDYAKSSASAILITRACVALFVAIFAYGLVALTAFL